MKPDARHTNCRAGLSNQTEQGHIACQDEEMLSDEQISAAHLARGSLLVERYQNREVA